MEILAGLLAWLLVGFACLVVVHSASPIRKAAIPYWKWYHFVLAVVLWPWLLVEIVIANFMGYFK